jgi:peptidoglycan/LPS O-acetylase OafA/YrhL
MLMLALPYIRLSFGVGRSAFHAYSRGVDLSYGMFLYAFPVQQILTLKLGPQIGPWWNFFLATIISAALAYLSWMLVEKPALSLKPRDPVRPGAQQPPAETAALPGYT